MLVSIEVTDDIRREAEARGLPIVDFVEQLVSRGLEAVRDRAVVSSAIDRIRALRAPVAGAKR